MKGSPLIRSCVCLTNWSAGELPLSEWVGEALTKIRDWTILYYDQHNTDYLDFYFLQNIAFIQIIILRSCPVTSFILFLLFNIFKK